MQVLAVCITHREVQRWTLNINSTVLEVAPCDRREQRRMRANVRSPSLMMKIGRTMKAESTGGERAVRSDRQRTREWSGRPLKIHFKTHQTFMASMGNQPPVELQWLKTKKMINFWKNWKTRIKCWKRNCYRCRGARPEKVDIWHYQCLLINQMNKKYRPPKY